MIQHMLRLSISGFRKGGSKSHHTLLLCFGPHCICRRANQQSIGVRKDHARLHIEGKFTGCVRPANLFFFFWVGKLFVTYVEHTRSERTTRVKALSSKTSSIQGSCSPAKSRARSRPAALHTLQG